MPSQTEVNLRVGCLLIGYPPTRAAASPPANSGSPASPPAPKSFTRVCAFRSVPQVHKVSAPSEPSRVSSCSVARTLLASAQRFRNCFLSLIHFTTFSLFFFQRPSAPSASPFLVSSLPLVLPLPVDLYTDTHSFVDSTASVHLAPPTIPTSNTTTDYNRRSVVDNRLYLARLYTPHPITSCRRCLLAPTHRPPRRT